MSRTWPVLKCFTYSSLHSGQLQITNTLSHARAGRTEGPAVQPGGHHPEGGSLFSPVLRSPMTTYLPASHSYAATSAGSSGWEMSPRAACLLSPLGSRPASSVLSWAIRDPEPWQLHSRTTLSLHLGRSGATAMLNSPSYVYTCSPHFNTELPGLTPIGRGPGAQVGRFSMSVPRPAHLGV